MGLIRSKKEEKEVQADGTVCVMAKRYRKASGRTEDRRPVQLEHSRTGRMARSRLGSGKQMTHRECRCCPVVNKKLAKLHSDVLTPVLKRPVGQPLLLSSDTVKTNSKMCYFLILFYLSFCSLFCGWNKIRSESWDTVPVRDTGSLLYHREGSASQASKLTKMGHESSPWKLPPLAKPLELSRCPGTPDLIKEGLSLWKFKRKSQSKGRQRTPRTNSLFFFDGPHPRAQPSLVLLVSCGSRPLPQQAFPKAPVAWYIRLLAPISWDLGSSRQAEGEYRAVSHKPSDLFCSWRVEIAAR